MPRCRATITNAPSIEDCATARPCATVNSVGLSPSVVLRNADMASVHRRQKLVRGPRIVRHDSDVAHQQVASPELRLYQLVHGISTEGRKLLAQPIDNSVEGSVADRMIVAIEEFSNRASGAECPRFR